MVESISTDADQEDVDERVEEHRSSETHATEQPPENHALGGGVHDASTRAAINGLVSDAALESEQGAQGRVDNHTATEVHDEPQPPAGKGQAGGVAELDDTGVLRAGQVPDLALGDVFTVQTEADLTGLNNAVIGDVGIVLDQSISYILSANDPSTLSNWVELQAPPAPVQDVFGRTGSVNPASGDYTAAQITNFNSTAADAAPVQSVNGRTGTVSGLFEASDYSPEADTHDRYTDGEASAASPVQDVEGKTGSVDLAASDVGAEPSGSVEDHRQNETHATAQPPETHGDTEHDNTVPSQSDVDAKADDPHGNAAHSSTFAVDGDAQPPENHDNSAHSENYTTSTEAANAAPVQDVFGRTGSVNPASGDYTAAQITNFNSTAADAAPVQSVNGRTGTVSGLFEASDYSPESDTHDRYTDGEASAASPVQDVFGRTGSVTPLAGDYSAAQITNFNSSAADAAPVQSVNGSTGDVSVVSGGVIVEAQGPLGSESATRNVAPLSVGREDHAAAEANGLVYAVGGFDSDFNDLALVEQYDPSTDSWSTVSPMPTPRRNLAAAEANGLVYAIAGSGPNGLTGVVEVYDPETDTWSTVSSLPIGSRRRRLAAAEANGLVYAIGGENQDFEPTGVVEEYDPSTDTWSAVASLSTSRFNHAAAEANGLVYAIGGEDGSASQLSTVEQYDPSTDSWSTVSPMPTPRLDLAAAEANGLVCAIGGEDSNFNSVGVVEVYDPSTDTWSAVASLSTPREALAAAEANGLVYAVGGDGGNTVVEEVEVGGVPEDVYTAEGDSLIGIDDPDGKLLNRTTGREVTGGTQLARNGETIAVFTEKQARVYRTEET